MGFSKFKLITKFRTGILTSRSCRIFAKKMSRFEIKRDVGPISGFIDAGCSSEIWKNWSLIKQIQFKWPDAAKASKKLSKLQMGRDFKLWFLL